MANENYKYNKIYDVQLISVGQRATMRDQHCFQDSSRFPMCGSLEQRVEDIFLPFDGHPGNICKAKVHVLLDSVALSWQGSMNIRKPGKPSRADNRRSRRFAKMWDNWTVCTVCLARPSRRCNSSSCRRRCVARSVPSQHRKLFGCCWIFSDSILFDEIKVKP